jgi:sugar lactone lactonase YvrE
MHHSVSRLLSLLAFCALVTAAVLGCGGPSPSADETSVISAPIELLLETTISGMVQGLPLNRPVSLAVSDRGAVYLLDAGNRRVVWFSRDLAPLRDFDGRGDLAARFSEPRSVAVDADHNVWVSDFGSRRLVRTSDRLDLTAEFEFRDDTVSSPLGRPGSIAVTGFGDIWVIDEDNQRIVVLNPLGELDQTVGDFGHPGGKLDYPAKILAGPDDHVWVCDRENRRIVVYDGDGGLVREITDRVIEDPLAIALDPARRVWILDGNSGRIHCFDRNGRYLSTVGPTISGSDQPLLRPTDLAFLPDGRLLIADTGHDRILVCRPIASAPASIR